MLRSVAFDHVVHIFPKSHKNDPRLIWVNYVEVVR